MSVSLCGCASRQGQLGDSPRDNGHIAHRMSSREIGLLLSTDPVRAEAVLRSVIAAEPFNGPAHNNLGVALLRQGRLYEAANACEAARKLMPGNPDPRINLALVLERAGRVDEAIDAFEAALEVSPSYIPAAQGLTRLQISSNRSDHRTASMLREIALRGETLEWREWARIQGSKFAR